jgi:hypothetical protein
MKAIGTRLQKFEAQCQYTEEDSRKSPGWLAYRQTLLKYLADYPQKGLIEDVQRAFDNLEVRLGSVTDADQFYVLEPLWQKHCTEFAPDPRTSDHFALIARFKTEGLTRKTWWIARSTSMQGGARTRTKFGSSVSAPTVEPI